MSAGEAKSIQRILRDQDEIFKSLSSMARRLSLVRTTLLGTEDFDKDVEAEAEPERPKAESFLESAIELNQRVRECLGYINTQLVVMENACIPNKSKTSEDR